MTWWENAEQGRASTGQQADEDRDTPDLQGDPVYPTTDSDVDLLAELQRSVTR